MENKNIRRARARAFTLVELIVVIAILAVLATIGFLSLQGYSNDAKDSALKANVRSAYSAISSESALSGNSPRYYVVHDSGAALTWAAVAYVDGSAVTLSGGDWNQAGTNYSAGNPDWAKLRLNPDKFRISFRNLPEILAEAFAAYDPKSVSVGAMDAVLAPSASGRSRSTSFFQAAGVSPSTGLVSVAGNFPAPTAAQASSWAVAGLVRNPSSASSTGALADGVVSGSSSSSSSSGGGSSSSSSGGPSNSCAANPSFANVGTLTTGSPASAGQAWTYSAAPGNCTYACLNGYSGTNCATAPSNQYPGCDTPDLTLDNGQVWAMCNVGATKAWTGGVTITNCSMGASDCDSTIRNAIGSYFQWGRNEDVTALGSGTQVSAGSSATVLGYFAKGAANNYDWLTDAAKNDNLWGGSSTSFDAGYFSELSTNDQAAMKGPCAAGYHVPTQVEWWWAFATINPNFDNSWGYKYETTFAATLKLPLAGQRTYDTAAYYNQGTYGYYWTSTISGKFAYHMELSSTWVKPVGYQFRTYGFSVRCLKN